MSDRLPQHYEDLATLAFFLLWLEKDDPGAMWGGHKIGEVIEALARLWGCPVQSLRGLIND